MQRSIVYNGSHSNEHTVLEEQHVTSVSQNDIGNCIYLIIYLLTFDFQPRSTSCLAFICHYLSICQ